MVHEGLHDEWVADLPHGVAIPILEMMRICQSTPPPDWTARAYAFISRADLAAQCLGEMAVSRDLPMVEVSQVRELGSRQLNAENVANIGEINLSIEEGTRKSKGLQPALPHVRFGSDRRVREVERIMQTTKVRMIAVQDPKNAK